MAEVEAALDETAAAATTAPSSSTKKEAGAGPAVTMADKTDAGSADLIDRLVPMRWLAHWAKR